MVWCVDLICAFMSYGVVPRVLTIGYKRHTLLSCFMSAVVLACVEELLLIGLSCYCFFVCVNTRSRGCFVLRSCQQMFEFNVRGIVDGTCLGNTSQVVRGLDPHDER